MLKDIVDETSHGKYDFMYLRIGTLTLAKFGYTFNTTVVEDFANNCKYVIQLFSVDVVY